MSDEKFAKGEWVCDYRNDGCAYLSGPETSYSDRYFENAYDAYLIAAAPEMYGLLKRLLNGGCLVYGDDIDSVEDLLAKARGES